jgi:hypothetical protein
MLHTDAGELGAWEFPDGPDVPVKAADQVITPAFRAAGGAPAILPATGGFSVLPWLSIALLVIGLLALTAGLTVVIVWRTR